MDPGSKVAVNVSSRAWRQLGTVALLSGIWLGTAWAALAAGIFPALPRLDPLCVAPGGAYGCFDSLQEAVDDAAAGDIIVVAGGVYSESVYVDRVVTVVGGWQPAGHPLTETIITAAGAPCALDLNGGGGAYRNLTFTGATEAGICGLMVGNLTLDRVTVRNNELDGISLLVGSPLTVTGVVARENGRDGLSYLCLGSGATVVRIHGGEWRENGRHGISGGFSCENDVQSNVVADNGGSGLEGFGGPCPVGAGRQLTLSVLARNEIGGNRIGFDRVCGGRVLLSRNWISGNVTGTRVIGEGSIRSENNLFLDNHATAWLAEGDVTVESVNDTMAGHGNAAFALRAEPGACARHPRLQLVNGIIWSTPAAFVGANDAACEGWPAYQIGVSYTLLVTPAAYLGDLDVIMGVGVGGDAPGFVGDGTRRLAPGAPAVDAGWNGAEVNEDYAGARRPADGDMDGVAVSDVGAYEYVPPQFFLPIIAAP